MLLIEYGGHICLRSLTDGHFERHLEYFKTFNDARVASVGFIKYNASTTRINKEKYFQIKFQVIPVFHRTIMLSQKRLQNFQKRYIHTHLKITHYELQKTLKLPPLPKPYGPGFNMQYFPNIFYLLSALNVRL